MGSAARHGRSAPAFRKPRDVARCRLECGALGRRRPLTDRLSLTNALADANIDRQKAERIAIEIFDAIHDNVATKQDLQALEQRMLLRFAEVEARIDRVIVRLGSLIVVLTGLLFAALHYWPPHG
jgi:hypothetical protein